MGFLSAERFERCCGESKKRAAYFFGPGLLFLGCVFWAGEGDEVFVRHPNVVGSYVRVVPLCFEVGTN